MSEQMIHLNEIQTCNDTKPKTQQFAQTFIYLFIYEEMVVS